MNPNVILCPIEFSASGTSALAQAVELARWYDADLHLAHVRGGRARRHVSGEPLNGGGVDLRLSSLIEAVDTEGLRLSTVVLAGDPLTAVTEHAKLIGADLVVVARHGRRHGAFWRSRVCARDLARVLPCPTLAVPDGEASGTASELDADLIVMGQPERSVVDRVAMASTATPVLRSAVCPVLLVRPSGRDLARVMPGESADPEATDFATEHMSVDASTAQASGV
jgi:nucleotide-binding universal stress UspA family protein